MIYFNSDYLEGAHPSIMVRLAETNMVQTVGYGEDEYCEAAREKIKTACQAPEADVHFLVGGTQPKTTVIAAILRPWQGVISAVSGHINCHEAGAIESTGHKVITLPTTNGKITAQQVQDYVEWHRNDESTEHIVQPGMVYISHPTEGGTLYTKAELTALFNRIAGATTSESASSSMRTLESIYQSINSQMSVAMRVKDESVECDLETFRCSCSVGW